MLPDRVSNTHTVPKPEVVSGGFYMFPVGACLDSILEISHLGSADGCHDKCLLGALRSLSGSLGPRI